MSFPDDLQHLIRDDEPLGPLTWLGIGGPARYFAEPTDRDEMIHLVRSAASAEVPVRILGGGSNILVREAGFDGLVISLASAPLSQLHLDGSQLTAGAGARLSHAITRAVGGGLAGLEHLTGIPGTVGGALSGNASAGGGDIGSVVASVEVLDPDGTVRTVDQSQIEFSHRKSSLSGMILLSAQFRLEASDTTALTKRLQKLWIVRRSQRPTDEPRVAMPFVDPDGASVADLINQVGLSGIRQGHASLDPQNSCFLIAHSGATSDDCLQLIERVREQVSLQTGIDLQLNLQIW